MAREGLKIDNGCDWKKLCVLLGWWRALQAKKPKLEMNRKVFA
jgi:hypothetical protein